MSWDSKSLGPLFHELPCAQTLGATYPSAVPPATRKDFLTGLHPSRRAPISKWNFMLARGKVSRSMSTEQQALKT